MVALIVRVVLKRAQVSLALPDIYIYIYKISYTVRTEVRGNQCLSFHYCLWKDYSNPTIPIASMKPDITVLMAMSAIVIVITALFTLLSKIIFSYIHGHDCLLYVLLHYNHFANWSNFYFKTTHHFSWSFYTSIVYIY